MRDTMNNKMALFVAIATLFAFKHLLFIAYA